MRSLLGRHPGEEKEQIDKEIREGETRDPAPTMWTEMEHNLDTEPDLDSDSEQEQSTEDVSSTPMEDGE